MFNASNLLGALMDGGLSGASRGRVDRAVSGAPGGGGQGALGQLLQGFGGSTGSGGLLDALSSGAKTMFGDASRSVKSGNPLAIGGLGALAGALLGGGGDSVKGALGGSAMAILGSLAIQALQGGKQDASQTAEDIPLPVGLRPPSSLSEQQQVEDKALLILGAMINAAKADGQVDQQEAENIAGKLRQGGVDSEAEAFVDAELRKPMDTAAILRGVTDPATAVEVYAASVLAIEIDTQAERKYLADLARDMGLDQTVVQRLHTALGVA
jgi:uncharacterized membrane protein YebE (DUF533 family)